MRRAWLPPLLLAGLTTAMLISAFASDFIGLFADESLIVWAGQQVADGRTPYLDFFSFLPPLMSYGPGALFVLVEPSIAALRFVTMACILATTLLLYVLVRARGVERWPAAGVALLLPALLVPIWPITSHYWFGLAFTAAAGAVAIRPLKPVRSFMAALFAGLALATLQSAGILAIAIVAARMLTVHKERAATFAAAASGFLIPVLFFGLLLSRRYALREAFEHIVLWPLSTYRLAGGFNDLRWSELLSIAPSQLHDVYALDVLALTFVLVLFSLPVLHTALYGRTQARGADAPRWRADALVASLAVALFLAGRRDLLHLALWTAPLLFVFARTLSAPTPARGQRAARMLLAVMLVTASLRWGMHWITNPPSLAAVANVDQDSRAEVHASILDRIPHAVARGEPILLLSMHGSRLYLEHAPLAPPLDWVLPPSARTNSTADYTRLAEFVRRQHVPHVVVPDEYLSGYLTQASPIRELLEQDYRPARDIGWATVYGPRTAQ